METLSNREQLDSFVQIGSRIPPSDAERLHEIAKSIGERQAALLRTIIHAALLKLSFNEALPSTLGGIENAIIK